MRSLTASVSIVLLAFVLTLSGGCASDYPEDSASGAAVGETDLVQRAATIALEIEADPEATEEILQRHGITPDEFEEMLLEISRDEELRKAYNTRLGG